MDPDARATGQAARESPVIDTPDHRPASLRARGVCYWAALGAICGTALWVSLGVLDAYSGPSGVVRLATLPSLTTWSWLVVGVTAAVAILSSSLGLSRGVTRSGGPTDGHEALVPLAATGVLVLPYLPWLPDVFPVLTVLAGPIRWVVWFVAAAETVRRLVASRQGMGHTPVSLGANPTAAILFLVGTIVAGFGGERISRNGLYPAGDEPHYLIVAQSLWRDGDLTIENNHLREDYREYYLASEGLRPDYLTRGVDGEIYSIHPVGLPLVLAPVYALGGYELVRLFLATVSAGTLALVAWWLLRRGFQTRAVVFGWVAVFSSAPFFFFTFAVYPEMMAGLFVVIAIMLLGLPGDPDDAEVARRDAFRWLGTGLSAGWLPWLSSKYAPMAAAIVLIAIGRIWWVGTDTPRPSTTRAFTRAALVLLPFAASLAVWLGFFHVIWGSAWPEAPYGGDAQTDLYRLTAGLPGLLFDQEYGVLPNAPSYLLALIGLVGMWWSRGTDRRLAAEVTLLVAALLGTVGAHHMWWGGSVPPGRPVVSVLPLLAIPIVWLYTRTRDGSHRKPYVWLVVFSGIGVTGLFALGREGLLLANNRDGAASLLEYLSPVWSLPTIFPTVIATGPHDALRVVAVWLAVGLATTWALMLIRRVSIGLVLARAGIVLTAVVIISVVVPFVAATDHDQSPLDTRWQIGFLDRFDATQRPTGVIYDPFRLARPIQMAGLLHFAVDPPLTAADEGPASALLYGHRLALPGGRYDVEMQLTRAPTPTVSGRLSVMVGRLGNPFETWEVSMSGHETWKMSFELATGAGYVGFLATPELAAARPRLVVRPTRMMDAHLRHDNSQVFATFRTDTTAFYFLDPDIWTEPTRVWTQGGRHTEFLMAPSRPADRSATSAQLTLFCGPVENTVEVTSGELRQTASLAPDQRHELIVPVSHGSAVVGLTVTGGFTPAELSRGNDDRRYLGCQVESVRWIS